MAKVRFWEQQDFYGIDFSPLAKDAKDEVFGQPIVGGFDARTLLSPAYAYQVDFRTITTKEIQDIVIPFTWVAQYTGTINEMGLNMMLNMAHSYRSFK
jgi:histone-arginine methyltransferase CARM1